MNEKRTFKKSGIVNHIFPVHINEKQQNGIHKHHATGNLIVKDVVLICLRPQKCKHLTI